jgi:heat shock protein HslJ/membrane-bound inhibitor of C-type lysozyme
MRRHFVLMALVGLLSLSACKKEENANSAVVESAGEAVVAPVGAPAVHDSEVAAAVPEVTNVIFKCGEQIVHFTLIGEDRADMRIENVSYAMGLAISASGAKYENLGEPETYLWSKGNKATVSIKGEYLPECTEIAELEKPEKPYKAFGNEPGWNVVVAEGNATLTMDYGDKVATLPVIADEVTATGRTITAGSEGGQNAVITIAHERCADGMSGELFADTVGVEFDGQTYQGCGQSIVRDVLWQLEEIAGTPVVAGSEVTLFFDQQGRLYGGAGCNRYNGGYSLEGENLSVSPNLASTMMACFDDATMKQEFSYLQTLPEMMHVSVRDDGALVLSDGTEDAGNTLIFRQVDE